MPGEGSKLLPSRRVPDLHVPDLDRIVTTSGGNDFSVGAKRHGPNTVFMSGEGSKLLPSRRIPDLDGFTTSGGNDFPVGAQGYASDTFRAP